MLQLQFQEKTADWFEQEITQRDQFCNDEVSLVASLVRESHQNSLDAKSHSNNGAVTTRIRIVEPNKKNCDFFRSIFSELTPHLQASDIDITGIDFEMPRLLLIEDFGTTGLHGSYENFDDGAFSDFWRRSGKSHKSGISSGRWGLGKTVFSSVSNVRTFFGLTIRDNGNSSEKLLMGQTALSTHSIKEKKYAPHGFYSRPHEDRLPLPVLDDSYINQFRKACNIVRENQPGLSIIIPFFLDQITAKQIIPEVLKNYFFPILTGQLEVDIDGELISKTTFSEISKKYAAGPDSHLTEFITKILDLQSKAPDVELKDTWPKNIEGSIDPKILSDLRKKYMNEGKLIHIKVPIKLKRKDGRLEQSHFTVFLQRAPDGVRKETLYVRGAITVPDEARYFRARQTFGAMVARDPSITSFLGDAENPSHSRWNGEGEKLRKNWQAGRARLHEIRESLNGLHQALTEAVKMEEPDALKDFFSLADADVKPGPKPHVPRPDVPLIPRTPKNFSIEPQRGGFTIKSGPGLTPEKLPLEIKVKVAYDVIRGNPFSKFDPLDFNFNEKELKFESQGAICSPTNANQLLIEVKDVTFHIQVKGFDENRDVLVVAR